MIAFVVALGGCAQPAPAPGSVAYHCADGSGFSVRFQGDTVVLDGLLTREVLVQSEKGANRFRSPRLSAEFEERGGARIMVLRYPLQPLALRCASD